MLLENHILDSLIQDNKKRIVLGSTSFGDIFFKEENGYQQEIFLVLKVATIKEVNLDTTFKGKFSFTISIVSEEKSIISHLIKPKLSTPVLVLKSLKFANIYNAIALRHGLKEKLKKSLGKCTENEVYAYAYTFYNTTLPSYAKKVSKKEYFKELLSYVSKYPDTYYGDIYELDSKDAFGSQVQKKYYGYGFSIPKQLYTCLNLKSFAVWNYTAKELDDRLLHLKNLNQLTLRNLTGLPLSTVDSIYKLKYLVNLELTNSDNFSRTVLTTIPKGLEKLENLKYFAFSGHKPENWEKLVTLKNLKSLELVQCGLTEISNQIDNLQHLEVLYLNSNNITELPKQLVQLKKLKTLRLNCNPLKEIPEWIGEMQSLEVLDLSQSGLVTLPKSIGLLKKLKELKLKKNPFKNLPAELLELPKKVVDIEIRNKALYDPKAKIKLDAYPKGNCSFNNDFNFKLLVINKLMYQDEVLVPKFNVWEFAKNYKARKIDIEKEGYNRIPEVEQYFKKLVIPMELLIDIFEIKPDGGDEIYAQIIPFWDGEDNQFNVGSIKDIKHLPNFKATNNLYFSNEQVKELRKNKIRVRNYA